MGLRRIRTSPSIFTARNVAECGIAKSSCPSICLSMMLRCRGHRGVRTIAPPPDKCPHRTYAPRTNAPRTRAPGLVTIPDNRPPGASITQQPWCSSPPHFSRPPPFPSPFVPFFSTSSSSFPSHSIPSWTKRPLLTGWGG